MSEYSEADRAFDVWARERFWSNETVPMLPRVAFIAGWTAVILAQLEAQRAELERLGRAPAPDIGDCELGR